MRGNVKEFDLISLGEVLIDFIPTGRPNELTINFGGAPANVAVAVARNGLKSGFCGMVGNDDFGNLIATTFEEENVDFLCDEFTEEAITTLAFVQLDEHGDRSFTFARKPGADMFLDHEQIPPEQIANTKMLNAGTLSMTGGKSKDTTIYALKEAARQNKIVTMDLNYRPPLWDYDMDACADVFHSVLPYVDLLKISDEEAPMLRMSVKEVMKKYDLTAVIETLGADGSRVYFQDDIIEQPGIKADVKDTTGAGDAFWGAFLSEILRTGKEDVQDLSYADFSNAIKMGAISGYYCVQQKGAIESLPTYEEIIQAKKELKI